MNKSNKLNLINNFREKYSSHSDILNLPNGNIFDAKYNFCKYINNTKIIGINNFNFKILGKNIKYSIYYTNPFSLDKKILNRINLNQNKSSPIYTYNCICAQLLDKILINKTKLSVLDKININLIVNRKKFHNNFIRKEESILILWFIINKSKSNPNLNYYMKMLKYYWNKIKLKTFNIYNIIDKFIYSDLCNGKLIKEINFHISLYLLLEEFHLEYMYNWLNDFKFNLTFDSNYDCRFILNSNYTKINPYDIINNFNQNATDIYDLMEQIKIPLGHNFLLIYNSNKIYYYDPDEQDLYDLVKLSNLFKLLNIPFSNISNRMPIQTITDDINCLFYCLGFCQIIEKIYLNGQKINLSNLKYQVLIYEKNIIRQNNINNWILNFISNFSII